MFMQVIAMRPPDAPTTLSVSEALPITKPFAITRLICDCGVVLVSPMIATTTWDIAV
jgi:hypothetical protein